MLRLTPQIVTTTNYYKTTLAQTSTSFYIYYAQFYNKIKQITYQAGMSAVKGCLVPVKFVEPSVPGAGRSGPRLQLRSTRKPEC